MKKIILRPSSAHRWVNCTASIQEEMEFIEINGIPEVSIYALNGIRIHEFANIIFKKELNDIKEYHYKYKNKEGLLKEGIDIAIKYIDFLKDNKNKIENGLYGEVKRIEESMEEKINIYDFKNDNAVLEGTPDYYIFIETKNNKNVLEIIDLKTGVQIVYPNSPQLCLYAYGIIKKYKNIKRIIFTIFQPKLNLSNSYETNIEEVKKEVNEYIEAANNIIKNNTEYKPNKKTCQWCLAKNKCFAYTKSKLTRYKFPSIQ